MDSKLEQAKEWVDAEKVRELLDKWAVNPSPTSDEVAVLNDVEALLAPPLPTFEDMTAEEREASQWMQAQVFTTASTLGIIANVDEYARSAIILFTDGMAKNVPWKEITPLPGPKLEWPGGGVEDAPAMDCEPTLPRPEDVPEGEPWIVQHEGLEWVGVRTNDFRIPWSITTISPLDYRDVDDSEITLISRLVPERKENA